MYSRNPENGVPRRAILISYMIISFMAMFDFNVIVGVDNFLSSLACVTELCAVVRLRFTLPELERPYKVGLSDRHLLLVMILPFCIGSFVMINEFTKSRLSMILNCIALLCGILSRKVLRQSQQKQLSPRASKILTQGFPLVIDTPMGTISSHDFGEEIKTPTQGFKQPLLRRNEDEISVGYT